MKQDNSNSAHKNYHDSQYLGYKSETEEDIEVYLYDNNKGLSIEIDGNRFLYNETTGDIEKE